MSASSATDALALARSHVALRVPSSRAWAAAAVADLPTLLEDHAQCELKAASTALSLIARNPERDTLVMRMMALAREELLHYRQVRDWMRRLAIPARKPRPSPYLAVLSAFASAGPALGDGIAAVTAAPGAVDPDPLLRALVLAAVIEARSCERFVALCDALATFESALDAPGTGESKQRSALFQLYDGLARSEGGHAHLFVELAELYFAPARVQRELDRVLEREAEALARVPLSARMHGGNGA